MKRRDFIKGIGAALALPTIIPASALGKNGFIAPSNRVVLGSIGLGGMGSSNTNNFTSDKRVQLVALCDPCDIDNRYSYSHNQTSGAVHYKESRKLTDLTIYKDFRELLARKDIDAITTATPDHWHAIIGIACANAGKDVYGEKPLTRTIEEGRMLVNAVKRNGIIWQTGSWQRSNYEFLQTTELVRSGAIGKVKLVKIGLPKNERVKPMAPEPVPSTLDWEMWQGPAARTDFHHYKAFTTWRFFSEYSAGKIADWGAHHLDIAQWAMQYNLEGPKTIEPLEVDWPTDGFYDLPSHFKVRFTYERGEVVEMSDDNVAGLEIIGEKGTIYADRGRVATKPLSIVDTKIPYTGKVYGTEAANQSKHYKAFIDSVLDRRATVTDIENAHRTNTGCLLGEIAYTVGRKITWDWKTEKILNDPQAQRLCSRAYHGNWQLI